MPWCAAVRTSLPPINTVTSALPGTVPPTLVRNAPICAPRFAPGTPWAGAPLVGMEVPAVAPATA